MNLLSFHKLGVKNNSPHFWLESQRLNLLGFKKDTWLKVQPHGNRVIITPTSSNNGNRVSSRRDAGSERPIIDLNSRVVLAPLSGFTEIRIRSSYRRIDVTPSTRAFYIHKQLSAQPPFDTLELFCGGGLLSQALPPAFKLTAGVEIEPAFADVWSRHHPDATLIQADLRLIHPSELPRFKILVGGIPCSEHSNLGRAKKSLAGKPELGELGDMFLVVLHLIAHHLPLACVFENVPSFATSLAGLTFMDHLRKLGYDITETILDPHTQWNEPQDRKRWVMVGTLKPGFQLQIPNHPFRGTLGQFLDAPDGWRDRADSRRIAPSIASLKLHNARHRAQGHGFGFTTINSKSTRLPTLVKSYHKINTGPFVETPYGHRLLRKAEMERMTGCTVDCDHYATAVQIIGQGVQTRVLREILNQLSHFLTQ